MGNFLAGSGIGEKICVELYHLFGVVITPQVGNDTFHVDFIFLVLIAALDDFFKVVDSICKWLGCHFFAVHKNFYELI